MEIALALIEIFKDAIVTFAGLFIVWIILGAATSQLTDWYSHLNRWRANVLEDAITNIFADPELTHIFYNHPLIKSLHGNGGRRKPSSIPSEHFASVIFNLILKAGTEESAVDPAVDKIRKNVNALKANTNNDLRDLAYVLDALLVDIFEGAEKTDAALAGARQRVENWYNEIMSRLSEDYKRKIQPWFLIFGIVFAAFINADTLAIVNHLGVQPSPTPIEQSAEVLKSALIPLGWASENIPHDINGWLVKFGGIIFSGLVAAEIAPIWKDLIRRLLPSQRTNKPVADTNE